jgi:hypothetical protein
MTARKISQTLFMTVLMEFGVCFPPNPDPKPLSYYIVRK